MKKINPLKYIHYLTITFTVLFMVLLVIFVIIYSAEYVEITGEIRPEEYQIVSPKVSGIVLKKHFKDGDIVKKGDLLIEINSTEYEYKLSQLITEKDILESLLVYQEENYKFLNQEIDISNIKRKNDLKDYNLQRGQTLSEKDYQNKLYNSRLEELSNLKKLLSSNYDYQKNKKDLESLLFKIKEYELKISESKIYAQLDGIVIEDDDNIKEGYYFEEGNKVQMIFSNDKIYAQIIIPEKKIVKVELEQKVIIYITALPFTKYKVFKGKLMSLKKTTSMTGSTSSIINGGGSYYIGKVQIEDPFFEIKDEKEIRSKSLIFGMTLKGKIVVGKSNLINRLLNLE